MGPVEEGIIWNPTSGITILEATVQHITGLWFQHKRIRKMHVK